MYNVSCLDSIDFNQMADGSKTKEIYRYRWPDPQIDSVLPGEKILFLDMESDRALLSRVLSIRRIGVALSSTISLIYVLRISKNRRSIEFPMIRMPGWWRLNRKDLVPFLKGVAG
jgi:hypothetical protein